MGGIKSLDGLDNENADSQPALKNARAEAVEELRAAFNELKSGEGLTRLVGGHGVQSRVFEFEWSEPALGISFRMPYARVLSDEASQKDDDEEIGAVTIRYSEPKGFPFSFHWETTVALDGTSTTTPVEVVA